MNLRDLGGIEWDALLKARIAGRPHSFLNAWKIAHEVTNIGTDRAHLANVASQAKEALGAEHLDAVADRGYFSSPEILACERADITVKR